VRRGIGEGAGVGEFATEIKAADKGEGFAEGQLAFAEAKREREARFFAEDQLGANAGGIGRGEEKNARDRRRGEGRAVRWRREHALTRRTGRSFTPRRFSGFSGHTRIIAERWEKAICVRGTQAPRACAERQAAAI